MTETSPPGAPGHDDDVSVGPAQRDEVIVVEKEGFSKIWIVPIVALLVGIWLGYQQYLNRPVTVFVNFASGDGIVVGKTEVKFEGIKVGTIKDMVVQDDMTGVKAELEMDYRVQHYLVEGTQFWLVKPEVSFSGVTGLDTLVSGNYVGMKVGKGKRQREFQALENMPPPDDSTPGLHLLLTANDLGSLHVGSPVLYRKITVGMVSQYALQPDGKNVQFKIFISPEYADFVKKHSRFWNSSGVTIAGGLSGIEVKMDSLATLVAGGVSFDTPKRENAEPAVSGDSFTLFDDYDAAKSALIAFIRFPDTKGIERGATQVRYKGFVVGEVKSITHNLTSDGAVAKVAFDPRYEHFLAEGTRFWLVKPELSLSQVSGLDTLISGAYIEVSPGVGPAQTNFEALPEPPRIDYSLPGVRVKLLADELPAISRGSPILYRKVPVGEVQSFELGKDGKGIQVNVFIEKAYAHLLKKHSRFWNVSGVSIKGGLNGISVQTGTLKTLISGGIAFYTPSNGPDQGPAKEGDEYALYADYDKAAEQGVEIAISFPQGDGLEEGAPIKYQGIAVGQVRKVRLSDDFKKVVVSAHLEPSGAKLARKGARFWVVKPQLGITGATNLDTLIKGHYITVEPAAGQPGSGPVQYTFDGLLEPPVTRMGPSGLNVVVWARQRGSIKVGSKVLYRQMAVGEVKSVELAANAQSVLFYLNIEPRYAPLVRQNSVFWNGSGVEVDFGIFKGASLRTESLESVLEGGIAFASPDTPAVGPAALPHTSFKLYDKPEDSWLEWKPAIKLGSAPSSAR